MVRGKKTARKSTGGRIRIADPAPPPAPVPVENPAEPEDPVEEDPEMLLSASDSSEEPLATPPAPPAEEVPAVPAEPENPEEPPAQQEVNQESIGETQLEGWICTHHHNDGGDLPFPRLFREALHDLDRDHWTPIYVGTRYRHQHFPEEWEVTVVVTAADEYGGRIEHLRHKAPARRSSFAAGMADAAKEALTNFCSMFGPALGDTAYRYFPRRPLTEPSTLVASAAKENNPRLNALVRYVALLNSEYDAVLHELQEQRHLTTALRAELGEDEDNYIDCAAVPPRKKLRYNDPRGRTHLQDPSEF
jgi:hypothetical protein